MTGPNTSWCNAYATRAGDIDGMVNLHRSPATYLFHLEVVNLLVAFCSTQLYTTHATAYPGTHPFTEVLMKPPSSGCAHAALHIPFTQCTRDAQSQSLSSISS